MLHHVRFLSCWGCRKIAYLKTEDRFDQSYGGFVDKWNVNVLYGGKNTCGKDWPFLELLKVLSEGEGWLCLVNAPMYWI